MLFTFLLFSEALNEDSSRLISEAVSILPSVPGLCTPEASVNVLPSVLYLLTSTLREVALIKDSSSQKSVSATLQALKQLTTSPYTQNHKCSKDWVDLLQRFQLLIPMRIVFFDCRRKCYELLFQSTCCNILKCTKKKLQDVVEVIFGPAEIYKNLALEDAI